MNFVFKSSGMTKGIWELSRNIERAGTQAMREATGDLKSNLREDVVAAGLGSRLARTWRGKTCPERGESLEAAAYVWSKAPKIVDAFDRGVVIRTHRGRFLALSYKDRLPNLATSESVQDK
jgi:Family of unknown function (DUF6441)